MNQRLYFLDWLRVGAFALLIPYHAGLIFVDWGFHIRNTEMSELLKLPLLFVNQWRLPLLFFVAGAGSYFSIKKKNAINFSQERVVRLLIPLVFGILLIIPPQVYFERLSQGQTYQSYLHFYPEFFNGIYPEGNFTWNHLWFISYLLVFSLMSIPICFLLMKKVPVKRNADFYVVGCIGLCFLMCLACEFFLRPYWPDTRNLISDWYNFAFYLVIFLFGFSIAVLNSWSTFIKLFAYSLMVGILSFIIIYLGWHSPGTGFLETTLAGLYIFKIFKVINILAWITSFVGLCAKFLSAGSRILKYLNAAVYPFYILHQTFIITFAYFIVKTEWSIGAKYSLIVILSFISTWLTYHFIVLKNSFLYPIFGMKKEDR